jgi:hypothetical protein
LACRARKSGCVAEYGPARGDQVKGILLRHLHDAIQADIDVSAREGLDRANSRWRLDAYVHRPWRFPFFGFSLVFQLFGVSLVKLEDVLAGERLADVGDREARLI